MEFSASDEQLEDGEIVDDNDFEDISDNSILEPFLGKSLTSSEHLRAHYLSSDSCTPSRKITYERAPRRMCRHRRKRKISKLRSESLDSSDSDSDFDDTLYHLKHKLKEAVHISGIEENRRNDLQTRLKAMATSQELEVPESLTTPESSKKEGQNSPTAEKVQSPPQGAITIVDGLDKTDDTELEKLRLEALRTAMLNKYRKRKRRKTLDEEKKTSEIDNKENEQLTNGCDKKVAESLEEDEELLRADLLVDLVQRKADKKKREAEQNLQQLPVSHNKIDRAEKSPQILQQPATKPTPKVQPIKKNPSKVTPPLLAMKHKVVTSNPTNKMIPKPVLVKPLIINLNDSDSDDVSQAQHAGKTVVTKTLEKDLIAKPKDQLTELKKLSTNVDKFLKEQRAKFEKGAAKKPLETKTSTAKPLLEKSSLKLLPKSQQIEYQQLLRRLMLAERKKKLKQMIKIDSKKVAVLTQKQATPKETDKVQSIKVSTETLPVKPVEKVAVEIQVNLTSTNSCTREDVTVSTRGCSSEDMLKEIEEDKKQSGIINELTTLKNTLKEIRQEKNGSLQIKSNYQVLTPIIKKITGVSNERKKHEQHIKTLLQQLNEAKQSLAQSHRKFSLHVRELVKRKEEIDRSEFIVANGAKVPPVTSTPIKEDCRASLVSLGDTMSTITNHECEDMDICNSDETDVQIDIVDPNDIDQIFSRRKRPFMNDFPQYVSPLNLHDDRYNNVDPLGILCPYEVNGSCRDKDCTFKHYSKEQPGNYR